MEMRFLLKSIVGASLILGSAGKVPNEPSRTERLLGGLPRSFPLAVVFVDVQAEEVAGPCFLPARFRDDDGVTADRDSSK